ncbi:MAG: translesion error-prone DNA polymerase V autoproteolytic subunit [bacterium]
MTDFSHAEHISPSLPPFFTMPVAAGFPVPVDDHLEGKLDLNKHLVKHPAATFFVRAQGTSMINAGIQPGDLLIVDRSLQATDGRIVVAVVDSEFTVKRLKRNAGKIVLMPENPECVATVVDKESDARIWGVVTHVIKVV